jgi:hypothetical protein
MGYFSGQFAHGSQSLGLKHLILPGSQGSLIPHHGLINPIRIRTEQWQRNQFYLKGVGMEHGEYRADVFVQWSASTAPSGEPVHFDHQLYLVFRGENTEDTGFADHGCAQCGAPLPDTDSLECEYCGAKLPETNDDWLLDEIK